MFLSTRPLLLPYGCCLVRYSSLDVPLVVLLILCSAVLVGSSLFLGCAYLNALGLLEVKICSGLSCDESDARLIICTDLSRCSCFISSWIRGNLALSFWRCFAFSNFVCARAASFERISSSLLGSYARFVGAVPFRLGCLGAFAGWVLCDPLGPGWSFCGLLSPALLGPGWSIWTCDSGAWSVSFLLGWFFWFFLSVNKNSFIFSWFLLYSRTVLQATKCIRRGFVSLIIARSFFLTTTFLRLCVSSVIVVGE